jgi:hypothetical protein
LRGQTCCSGGVPLSATLGLPPSARNSWQVSFSYDFNYLNTLKNGSNNLDDNSRERTTKSLIIQSSYGLTKNLAIDIFVPYIIQNRTILQFGNQYKTTTQGIGDAALLMKYNILGGVFGSDLLLGLGPKAPTGKTNYTNDDGIQLNADLQPGSGSWDGIFYGLFIKQAGFRPSVSYSISTVYSLKGTNNEYFDEQSYHFGNELMMVLSVSDNLMIKENILNTSISFRYREQKLDIVDDDHLPNTGGSWMFLTPGLAYFPRPDWSINLSGDVPIYANVNGVQLTTTYRINVGIYMTFRIRKQKALINY